MLYVIIGIIVAIVVWYFSEYRGCESYYRGDKIEIVKEVSLYSLAGTMFGLIAYLVLGMILGCVLPITHDVETQPIYAMNDGSSMEGHHFLFSGYVDDKFVCRYVVETERGKHIEQVDAKNAYIVEQDIAQPYVEIYTSRFASKFFIWIALPMVNDDYYKFFVPEDTVITSYNIDLQ